MTRTIAIIGAGFSGTVIAARLLGESAAGALKVILINRSNAAGGLARGLAYGTQSSRHLLNVPAGRMSAFPEREDDFVRFLREAGVAADGGSFVPRRLYGEYLADTLHRAVASPAPGNAFEVKSGEVVALSRVAGIIDLRLADGGHIAADHVVLALGNFAPTNPSLRDDACFQSPRYVRDPWSPGALAAVDPGKPVLLIGTGLTMFDVVLSLEAEARGTRFIALSRRGLLPQPHRITTSPPAFAHAPEDILNCPPTARAYLGAVRRAVVNMASAGVDWRDVVASLRPITPALWQRLPPAERARFMRHVRPYWESHRHRAAPEIAAAIAKLTTEKRLAVAGARLMSLTDRGDVMEVQYRPRGAAAPVVLEVGAVINCTGPTSDFRVARERLLLKLHEQGMLKPDALALGIEVDEVLRVLDKNGVAQPFLHCVGPLLKARDWEATAVPELREHVRDAVCSIVSAVGKTREI